MYDSEEASSIALKGKDKEEDVNKPLNNKVGWQELGFTGLQTIKFIMKNFEFLQSRY